MILGRSKVTRSKKMVENLSKKKLKEQTKLNRKMGDRSFSTTSGAFGDTLMYNCQMVVQWLSNCPMIAQCIFNFSMVEQCMSKSNSPFV